MMWDPKKSLPWQTWEVRVSRHKLKFPSHGREATFPLCASVFSAVDWAYTNWQVPSLHREMWKDRDLHSSTRPFAQRLSHGYVVIDGAIPMVSAQRPVLESSTQHKGLGTGGRWRGVRESHRRSICGQHMQDLTPGGKRWAELRTWQLVLILPCVSCVKLHKSFNISEA